MLSHSKLLRWYKAHARPFPWRRTKDPYHILVSEIMAQQTQVQRVALFYGPWMKRFPTFSSLARSPKSTVLRFWSGLGYNNRALRLHQIARELVERGNRLPESVGELQHLPGIGKYTAHAIACFAFGSQVPVVDVNIRRVLSRHFWKVRSAADLKSEKEIWRLAVSLLPARRAGDWNQALMDLGATVCTARNPACDACPISSSCASAFSKSLTRMVMPPKRPEPAFKGVPRRVYRGRILKALHGRSLTPHEIGLEVVDRFRPQDIKWVEGVLERMEQENLVVARIERGQKRIRIAS